MDGEKYPGYECFPIALFELETYNIIGLMKETTEFMRL
jgi:hypothetical protein